jgi:fructokinase/N-acetylglucosamine kinase
MTNGFRIGIDLGGTKIEGIALDAAGRSLWRERVPAPQSDYRLTLDAIAALVQRIESDLGERGSVGVGTPGAASPVSGRMRNCNSTWLNGERLREDLCARLRREVRLANDADCFTLSEATDGAAAGAATVFGVILGTGVGGGICVGGRLLAGPNAIAGEWGHNLFGGPRGALAAGRSCYCGRSDCVETWLSGAGLLRTYRELRGVDPHPGSDVDPDVGSDVGPNLFGQVHIGEAVVRINSDPQDSDSQAPGLQAPGSQNSGSQNSGSQDPASPVGPHSCGQGAPRGAASVASLAQHGDRIACAALDLYVEQLAFALAQVINVLDPHVIVLGGGLSNITRLYDEVPARWGAQVFSDTVRTALVPARFGDSSGVRGAAWLFPLLP